MSSLDWCTCGHIRWWHEEGLCLSCSKAWTVKHALTLDTAVLCEFTQR